MSQYGIELVTPVSPSTTWVVSVIDHSVSPAYNVSYNVREQDLQSLASALNTAAGTVTPALTAPPITYVNGVSDADFATMLSAPDSNVIIDTI